MRARCIAPRWPLSQAGCVLVCVLLGSLVQARAREPRLWLSAIEPVWRQTWHYPPNDYLDLFRQGADWKQAAAEVGVVEFTKKFVIESPDALLASIIADLRRRRIAMSMQVTPLIATTACGLGVEGFGPPDDMLGAARKIRRLGGTLAYASMDEPLWYGHAWDGTPQLHACKLPIPEMVRQASRKLRDVASVFPAVQIGDVEPVGVAKDGWPASLATWLAALGRSLGHRVAYVHLDVVWRNTAWQTQFAAATRLVRSQDVDLGVIYNGDEADRSDESWTQDAQAHYELVEGRLKVQPDDAVFATWTDRPRSMLPDSKASSFTHLPVAYTSWRAQGKSRP